MTKIHGIDDCLELIAEAVPREEGEKWFGTEEQLSVAQQLMPTLVQLLEKMKKSCDDELTMNRIASGNNWGVVKLLEEDNVCKGQEGAEEKTKKLRQAI